MKRSMFQCCPECVFEIKKGVAKNKHYHRGKCPQGVYVHTKRNIAVLDEDNDFDAACDASSDAGNERC